MGASFGRGRLRPAETRDVPQPAHLEHHHFKFELPSQAWRCAHPFSRRALAEFWRWDFAADGDGMEVSFEGFGRALRNPVLVEAHSESPMVVRSLG